MEPGKQKKSLKHKRGSLLKPVKRDDKSDVLAQLMQEIIIDLGLYNRMNALIDAYVARSKNSAYGNATRSAIIAKLKKSTMTMKTTVFILFNIINVKKFTLTFELVHHNDKVSIHSITRSRPQTSEMDDDIDGGDEEGDNDE